MSEPEPMRWFACLFFVPFFAVWFWYVYLMLARPKTWVEWFLAKPWRGFGLKVSIEDEQKLRKKARIIGIVSLIFWLPFLGVFVLVPKR